MCKFVPKTPDNVTVATRYNFDAPINRAEEENDEDLELSEKMAKEIKRKSNNTQPYQEDVETINLSTGEDPKETKLRGNVRAEPQRSCSSYCAYLQKQAKVRYKRYCKNKQLRNTRA